MLEWTGISISVMATSQHDVKIVVGLQEWEIMSYYHSEASKQHRKILPCDSVVLQSQLSTHNMKKQSPKELSVLAHRLPP